MHYCTLFVWMDLHLLFLILKLLSCMNCIQRLADLSQFCTAAFTLCCCCSSEKCYKKPAIHFSQWRGMGEQSAAAAPAYDTYRGAHKSTRTHIAFFNSTTTLQSQRKNVNKNNMPLVMYWHFPSLDIYTRPLCAFLANKSFYIVEIDCRLMDAHWFMYRVWFSEVRQCGFITHTKWLCQNEWASGGFANYFGHVRIS